MIYDRPYMRREAPRQGPGILLWILITLLAVYIVQMLLITFGRNEFGQSPAYLWLEQMLVLNSEHLFQGKIWTLLSYSLLHSPGNHFHILFNGITIFFAGRMVQTIYGERAVLDTFIVAALLGGIGYLLVHFNSGGGVVGASAAAFGLITLFCISRPNQQITLLLFFVFPVTIKPKWLLWALGGYSVFGLIFSEIARINTSDGTAYSAHIGGMLGGYLYYRYATGRGFKFSLSKKATEIIPPRKKKAKSSKKIGYSVNMSGQDDFKEEVDRILDKINAQGFGSLTAAERETLDKAKEILRT